MISIMSGNVTGVWINFHCEQNFAVNSKDDGGYKYFNNL